ncbi:MSHA pilin protein MshA [Shewanella piezotolerans WP3]|uniref:MSHA pilin protein MshA n=1 Tax=Shewanella piezotolerans (strain WP3 / JCM 13877) TaxID=225849 RepID=B8CPC1_SHEPW|nr:prepilin-type N-terminal cleavage/methylation domain-containing protein [Shewanella piezotolerans]ACJ29365.1 MSHA pilin protein MshA [Shewanella piezotolerans WP3]
MSFKCKLASGFTLIELVMVIVLLAVLSIIATTKMLNTSSAAKVADVRSLAALITTQNSLAFAKSNLANIEKLEGCSLQCGNHPNWDVTVGEYYIDAGGSRLYVSLGYPIAPLSSSSTVNANYRNAFGLNEEQFYITIARTENSATAIVPAVSKIRLNEIENGRYRCHVVYSAPTKTRDYSVIARTEDC